MARVFTPYSCADDLDFLSFSEVHYVGWAVDYEWCWLSCDMDDSGDFFTAAPTLRVGPTTFVYPSQTFDEGVSFEFNLESYVSDFPENS